MTRIKLINILKPLFLLIITAFGVTSSSGQPVVKQGPPVPVSFCIDANEMDLFRMINEYRQLYNLPPISLSKSLSYVAELHAKDLFLNHPDQGSCNFHSWSNKGFWTPFCYPKDETKKNSVWDKPRSLTKYPSKAYEVVYWENNPLVKDTIMMVWKTEEYFNSFLLNTGKWQGKTWNAIGIAVFENYACAWFGEVPDPEGDVLVCGSKPMKPVQDTVKPVMKPLLKPKKPKTVKPAANKADSLVVKSAGTSKDTLKTTMPVNPQASNSPKDSITGTYYIIVKTNLSANAAKKLADTLRINEYPMAKVLEREGKIRVSVFESPDRAIVTAKLKEVKKNYKDAWLLKR